MTQYHQCTIYAFWLSYEDLSEPTATKALVCCSIQGMGYVLSFSPRWGSTQSISFFYWSLYFFLFFFFFFLVLDHLSLGPNLTHSYLTHLLTLTSTAPTLVLYLLSPTDIATLIINYLINLATILSTYPTNLTTLLITYLTNLTTILTTCPTNLATLHTQPPYWHKYFTNLITLIR